MNKVKVYIHFQTLTSSIEVTVWYPRLPITVWLSDPVLNAIKGFLIYILISSDDCNEKRKLTPWR